MKNYIVQQNATIIEKRLDGSKLVTGSIKSDTLRCNGGLLEKVTSIIFYAANSLFYLVFQQQLCYCYPPRITIFLYKAHNRHH
jgi:hypothetical protein